MNVVIWIFILATIYTVFQFGLLRVTDNSLSSSYYVPIKMANSSAFIAIMLISLFYLKSTANSKQDYLMIVAVVLCWLGDLFLGFYNQHCKKIDMIKGIISFALGHICYLLYMYAISPRSSCFAYICPIVMIVVFACLIWRFHLKLGRLKPACYIYALIVSAMFSKAVSDIFVYSGLANTLMGLGAILFFVSDFSIIFLYFYHFKNKGNRKIVHYFNLLTYYYGILLIVLSMVFR